MKLFLKIGAGIITSLFFVTALMFIIPPTRNFIFNTFAPYSQVYKEQQNTIDDLNEANVNNMLLLTETRTSLMNAEFKAISYQNEIGVLQNNLITSQNNLALVLSQKNEIQKSLQETNDNLTYMSNQLTQLRSQYRELNNELTILLDAEVQDGTRIDELYTEMNSVNEEITRIDNIVSGLDVATQTYEAKIAEYEKTIFDNNALIESYEKEIISLNSQIVELQETIKSLESVNQALNGDDSYKQLFQSIVGGTVTELRASDLEGLTEIRSYAFYNCKTLQSVELPESIETIGSYAFSGCSNLSNFTFPSNLKTIGQRAFENCTKLPDLDLRTVENVEGFAFSNTGINTVYIPSNISGWDTCIFQNSSVKNIYVEEGVTTIPFGMFHGCGQIENIYLPSTLQTIETYGISNYSTNVNVFFAGTTEQFAQISYVASENTAFADANVVCNYQY